nr:S-layer homology domain-containing protein [Candidatus Microthrix sp.]
MPSPSRPGANSPAPKAELRAGTLLGKRRRGPARQWQPDNLNHTGDGDQRTCASAPDPGFSDVALDAYYYDSVAWLVQAGITGGTAPANTRPTPKSPPKWPSSLWTNAGQPTPTPPHSFSDVPTDSYYNDARVSVRTGVTSGTAPGKYSPNAKVTRAQMAVFLWQYNGRLGAAGYHGFSDVPPFR